MLEVLGDPRAIAVAILREYQKALGRLPVTPAIFRHNAGLLEEFPPSCFLRCLPRALQTAGDRLPDSAARSTQ